MQPGMGQMLDPNSGMSPEMMQQQQMAAQQQQAMQPGMNQMLSPQQAASGPPRDPAELEQRKAGWTEFLTKIQSDPALRNTAMLVAGQLLKGPGMGQSHGAAMGQALQLGVTAHSMYRGNDQALAMKQQAAEQARLESGANISQSEAASRASQAQSAGLEQTQDFARQDRPFVTGSLANKQKADEFTVGNQEADRTDLLKTTQSTRDLNSAKSYAQRQLGVDRADPTTATDRRTQLLDNAITDANP